MNDDGATLAQIAVDTLSSNLLCVEGNNGDMDVLPIFRTPGVRDFPSDFDVALLFKTEPYHGITVTGTA